MGKKDINTLRADILAESLETANEPRFGYFGFAPPLAIGDNSQAGGAQRKSKEEEEAELLRSFVIAPPRKGAGPDSLFGPIAPLCIGDPYIDPSKRLVRKKCVPVDPEQMFKPPGAVKHGTGKGVVYVPQGNGSKADPKDIYAKYKETEFAILHPANIKTSALKKGGGGVLTPGVLLSPFPEHMPDNYDGAKELKRKELAEHAAKIQEGVPFRSMHYGGRTLMRDMEQFGFPREGEGAIINANVPRKLDTTVPGAAQHEAPFKPANPSKKGFNGLMGWPDDDPTKPPLGFPKWVPDPVPQPSRRKPPPDVEPPPAFRPSHGGNLDNPMKSVTMMTRNLRASNPASFIRPKI